MKYTLLELTQRVLESIKGEEINDINDTAESISVTNIIKECYFTLIAEKDLPEQKELYELNASGDNTKPVLMTLPDDVYGMDWLQYNAVADGDTDPVWRDLTFLQLKDFLKLVNVNSLDEAEVAEMTVTRSGSDAIQFKYRNDGPPLYFTTIDDTTLIFDSYDSSIENTLQKSKTQAFGLRVSDWVADNDTVLDIDPQQFVLLLKEAKVMAWQELKQIDNMLAARQSRDIRIASERKKNRANYNNMGYYYDQYPNYGRK